MADKKNKSDLTEKQKIQAKEWINKHSPDDLTCQVCKTTKWILGDMFVAPPSYIPQTQQGAGGISIGGSLYPLVPIICDNCGNTLFINAVMMGLIKGIEENKEGEENV